MKLNIRSFNWLTAISIVYLILFSSLSAEHPEENIVVNLETESPLAPLYLLPISQDPSELGEAYVEQLEKILAFDLDHNGATFITKRTSAGNQLGQNGPFNQLGSPSAWKAQHVFYVVKNLVEGKQLKTLLLNTQNQTLKTIDPISLTGDLNEDRRQIHRLSDTIYKALFGTEGIASTHILFTIKTGVSTDSSKWISEVWECDYDGGNLRQLTKERSTCVTPIYLPPKPGFATGAYLYVCYSQGQPKILICSLKDEKKRRLTTIRGNQLMPAVSRQRDKVAFICDITGNPDLFMQPFSPEQGAIGKPQQIFSARSATQGSPTFSPDGSKIAFVSNKDGSPKIYVIDVPSPGANINEIKPMLITRANRENSAPSWSPDGTKMAYCARGNGDRQIWVYDFNTNKETQITTGKGQKENPSWAPNSLHLVYNSSDPGSSNLFITHLNQNESTQITFGSGEKQFPNWEPRF
ncbi:MAG: Tol-Pal system protein TolB [Parachlamydiaceae bacterium]